MTGFSRFPQPHPEFDAVYASIANALRYTRGGALSQKVRMTKARVAEVHRKVLAGEDLDGDQERDIAGRLRQQLAPPG